MVHVREARPEELDELAAVSARAFEDDPLVRWVLPDDATRVDRLTRLEAPMAHRVSVPAGRHILATDDLAGIAVWAPPGTWKVSTRRFLPLVPALIRITGAGALRFVRGFGALERKHPDEPHWYLEG